MHPPVNPATAPVDSLLNQLPFLGEDFVLGLTSGQFGFSAVEKCKQTDSATNQVGRLTI